MQDTSIQNENSLAGEITQLLRNIKDGDSKSETQLLQIVYSQLKHIAVSRLRREREDHTFQPTDLVHEAYMRLFNHESKNSIDWQNRDHFFKVAALTMRRVLVDYARRKQSQTKVASISLEGDIIEPTEVDIGENLVVKLDMDLTALDDALELLGQDYPRASRVVVLRYFGGLTLEEVAETEGLSLSTVKREWAFAKAWLYNRLTPSVS